MIDVAVLVVSSKICSGEADDQGEARLRRYLEEQSARILAYDVVPDDRDTIRRELLRLCEHGTLQVIFTVGATGVRPTDWAPEATREIIEKEIPGLGEAMRAESAKTVGTAMLSRGTAGIRGRTMVINLPGSPKGVIDNLSTVFPILDHAVGKISGGASRTGGQHGNTSSP